MCIAKKINFLCAIRCANFSCFKNRAKMQKIPKNSKILKNGCHFQIPHPQISLKQFSHIFENVVYFFFFYYVGGGKMIKNFCKKK